MSEWYLVENKENMAISEDGEMLELLFNANKWGNQYVEIPIKLVRNILNYASKPQDS